MRALGWNPFHFEQWNDWTVVLMIYGYGIFLAFWRVRVMDDCTRAGRPLTLREHLCGSTRD